MKLIHFFLICISTIIIGCRSTESIQSSSQASQKAPSKSVSQLYKNKKDHVYNRARNILKNRFNGDNTIFTLTENEAYLELLYNHIYDDPPYYTGELNFIKSYIAMARTHPSWDFADHIVEMESKWSTFARVESYIQEGNEFIENWGIGYAKFVRSPSNFEDHTYFLQNIRNNQGERDDECNYLFSLYPPSKRPSKQKRKLFCRGYATTGIVLDLTLKDFFTEDGDTFLLD